MATIISNSIPSVIDAVEFRRKQYGINCAQWANVIGISRHHYSDFIHGKRNLTLLQSARCFAFGVPAVALFQRLPDKGINEIEKFLEGWGQCEPST